VDRTGAGGQEERSAVVLLYQARRRQRRCFLKRIVHPAGGRGQLCLQRQDLPQERVVGIARLHPLEKWTGDKEGKATGGAAGLGGNGGVEPEEPAELAGITDGGRQLDHAQASIEVLPEVAEAVDGRAEVLMDGGILRGTDIVKAVALGAKAVGIGKLHGWALAAAGEPGVIRMLELLELEIRSAMGLMGVTSLSQLTPKSVRSVPPISNGSVTSAYPMYEAALRHGETRP
jgi:hypothetical protein